MLKMLKVLLALVAALAVSPARALDPERHGPSSMPSITITGAGSTGDISRMRVLPDASAPANSLAKLFSVFSPSPVATSGGWPSILEADVQSGGPADAGRASSATVVAPGTGYTVGSIVDLVGGSGTPLRLSVASTGIVGATIISGGSGWTTGDTLYFPADVAAGEVYVTASARVTSVSGGAVTGISIYDQGTYTATGRAKTVFAGAPFSGSGTGLVFGSIVWGAATVDVVDPGLYTVRPVGSAVATATISGGGSGLTVDPVWDATSLQRLLGARPVRTRTTFGRLPATGVEHTIAGVPWMVAYHNDPTALMPGQNYAAGSDGTLTFNGFSNVVFASQYAARLPSSNPVRQLRGPTIDYNLDVPDPGVGSYIATLGFAGRTTGSSIVNMYYAGLGAQIVDPSPTNPRAQVQILTADTNNALANRAVRLAVGRGILTADATGYGLLDDPDVGAINAVSFLVSNKSFARYGTFGGIPGPELGPDGPADWLKFKVGNSVPWAISPQKAFTPIFDASADLGSASNRVRDGYLSGTMTAGTGSFRTIEQSVSAAPTSGLIGSRMVSLDGVGAYVTVATLTPSNLTGAGAYVIGTVKGRLSGITTGVGGGYREAVWQFSMFNGSIEVVQLDGGLTSTTYTAPPNLRLIVSGGAVQVQAASADAASPINAGSAWIEWFIPASAYSAVSWNVT